jgi:hypothetical protein
MSGDQFSDILARISCGEVDEPEKSDVVEAEAMEGLNRNLQTPLIKLRHCLAGSMVNLPNLIGCTKTIKSDF